MDAKAIQEIRDSFPILSGALLNWAYFDNAATTQKPESVIQAITEFYSNENANVHRGLYDLSDKATQRYENVRRKVKSFLGASHESEIAFTAGTTESINIIAHSIVSNLQEGDEVIVTAMEHHANFIPWQQACYSTRATLKVLPVQLNGELVLGQIIDFISPKTKFLSVTHISNVLGTINPIQEIIKIAHERGVLVLIDAAQSAGHYPLNVTELDADFLVFSAHKMFGPMGTGVLYVNKKHHNLIRPLIFGGGAIKSVTFQQTKFRDFPFCVEAGTPDVAGVLGLGAAVDFINKMKWNEIIQSTRNLASFARQKLKSVPFVTVIGQPENYGGIISFFIDGIHAHDVTTFLADRKIAVRAGHHCAQPLHDQLEIGATIRISFAIYNTENEVLRLIESLHELKKYW